MIGGVPGWMRAPGGRGQRERKISDERKPMSTTETTAPENPPCPGGCGCRLGTDDADRFECGCDGGCCGE